jgi:hypothetical protein
MPVGVSSFLLVGPFRNTPSAGQGAEPAACAGSKARERAIRSALSEDNSEERLPPRNKQTLVEAAMLKGS